MSDFIIRVENLGKKYKIRHQQDRQRYVALRDVIASKAAAPLRWFRQHGAWSMGHGATDKHGAQSMEHGVASNGRPSPDSQLSAPGSLLPASQSASSPLPLSPLQREEEFWALKGVTFEVKQGEVLGIIGRNGAGKTTLLKILSRITEPTEGRVRIRGRVASLLEVGTGFHPELTGRENIFVNGAILGMTRAEVQKKFDEIVDFSGVEKFIDTPVKRYSSGMYVRLAFAVAAHLEPEILVVDEVLAVGDVAFQKKCLGKMSAVAREGRTVLFVSHNLIATQSLCSRALVLYSGSVEFDGSSYDAVTIYLKGFQERGLGAYSRSEKNCTQKPAYVVSACIVSDGNFSEVGYPVGATLEFRVVCRVQEELKRVSLGIGINNSLATRVATLHSLYAGGISADLHPGTHEIRCTVDNLLLVPDRYTVKVSLESEQTALDVLEPAFQFEILPGDYYQTGRGLELRGLVLCNQAWDIGQIRV